MMNALGANMHPYFVKPPADAARFVAVVPGSDGCETHANMMRMLHKTVDEIILILPHFCGQHATSLVSTAGSKQLDIMGPAFCLAKQLTMGKFRQRLMQAAFQLVEQ